MTRGRSSHDKRRYIALVQVLALEGSDKPIRELCKQWGVKPIEDRSFPSFQGTFYLNIWATIRALAQHVIKYHEDEIP